MTIIYTTDAVKNHKNHSTIKRLINFNELEYSDLSTSEDEILVIGIECKIPTKLTVGLNLPHTNTTDPELTTELVKKRLEITVVKANLAKIKTTLEVFNLLKINLNYKQTPINKFFAHTPISLNDPLNPEKTLNIQCRPETVRNVGEKTFTITQTSENQKEKPTLIEIHLIEVCLDINKLIHHLCDFETTTENHALFGGINNKIINPPIILNTTTGIECITMHLLGDNIYKESFLTPPTTKPSSALNECSLSPELKIMQTLCKIAELLQISDSKFNKFKKHQINTTLVYDKLKKQHSKRIFETEKKYLKRINCKVKQLKQQKLDEISTLNETALDIFNNMLSELNEIKKSNNDKLEVISKNNESATPLIELIKTHLQDTSNALFDIIQTTVKTNELGSFGGERNIIKSTLNKNIEKLKQ